MPAKQGGYGRPAFDIDGGARVQIDIDAVEDDADIEFDGVGESVRIP